MLTDDSAVKSAYSDNLDQIGEALTTMYNDGALGANTEEFLANFRKYQSAVPDVENFDALANAVAADVAGVYEDDHLEFVSQVMPLIEDQDGYSYDVKERWYKDGELVTGEDSSGESGGADASGRQWDEATGLYYDDEFWYDENGVKLEKDDRRNLWFAGENWYDANFVPLAWNDQASLYTDSNNNWYDENVEPLVWNANATLYVVEGGNWYDENFVVLTWDDSRQLYGASPGYWFDENGSPLKWTETADASYFLAPSGARYDADAYLLAEDIAPVSEPKPVTDAAPADEPVADIAEAGPDSQEPAAIDETKVIDAIVEANLASPGDEDISPDRVQELIQQILEERAAATA